MRFYIDTCVWRDHHEDRVGKGGRDLGKESSQMLWRIIKNKNTIIFSDIVIRELQNYYLEEDVKQLFTWLATLTSTEFIESTINIRKTAMKIGGERDVPANDALHALLAKESESVLVTQDKDFEKLKDIVTAKKPSEVSKRKT